MGTNEELLFLLGKTFEPCSSGFMYSGDSIPTFNGEKLPVAYHTREVRDRPSSSEANMEDITKKVNSAKTGDTVEFSSQWSSSYTDTTWIKGTGAEWHITDTK